MCNLALKNMANIIYFHQKTLGGHRVVTNAHKLFVTYFFAHMKMQNRKKFKSF